MWDGRRSCLQPVAAVAGDGQPAHGAAGLRPVDAVHLDAVDALHVAYRLLGVAAEVAVDREVAVEDVGRGGLQYAYRVVLDAAFELAVGGLGVVHRDGRHPDLGAVVAGEFGAGGADGQCRLGRCGGGEPAGGGQCGRCGAA
jgi:hypothetical protein